MRGLNSSSCNLLCHDGMLHQHVRNKIRSNAGSKQWKKRIGLTGSFQCKNDGSKQGSRCSGKHGRHGHQCGQRDADAYPRKKFLSQQSKQCTSSATNGEQWCKCSSRSSTAQSNSPGK